MRKRKSMYGLLLLVAVLALGIGYAVISNVRLNVAGTANVKANGDFDVSFDTDHTVVVTPASTNIDFDEDADGVAEAAVSAGAYTDETNATMTVYLDSEHKTATAVYKIVNNSAELGATITADVSQFTGGNEEFLSVSKELYTTEECTTVLGSTVLNTDDAAYLKVTVSLDKLPAADITSATFGVSITASPAALSE